MAETCPNTTVIYLNETGGICAIVSLFFLLVILVVEIYYICCYKSNFTFRLFFYMTILAIAVDVSLAVNASLVYLCLTSEAYMYPYMISIGSVSTYIQYIEVMLFFSIQVTLVTKIYVSIADGWRNSLRSLGLFCSRHPERSEVMLMVVHILLPLPLLIALIENDLINGNNSQVFEYFFLVPESLSIIISCIFVVLLIWFLCILRRKNLLKKKTKQLCKEIGFIVGAQFVQAAEFIAVLCGQWHTWSINSALM